ncbi:MAG: class I SAM-dependent methyltransferase [Chloroflexi bacterium]|nr:class I SAM-dependent methyltransferase [Chloroflexota bacterium]
MKSDRQFSAQPRDDRRYADRRYGGLLRAVYARWPAFALIYGGIVFALVIIGLSIDQGWIGLIPLSLAAIIVLTYFFLASLRSLHLQYDRDGLNPHHILFDMGQIREDDIFVYVDLGERRRAIELARRLTTGKVVAVDVYNPQWTISQVLARARSRIPAPPPDPRLSWRNGRSDLIPLPDKSVTAVFLCQIASEFWQEGDRLQLLYEIYRVLSENGRLLLAEQARTQTNWALKGPAALALAPVEQWRDLLGQAGFRIRSEKNLQGVIHCIRADKPTYIEAQQLTLGL